MSSNIYTSRLLSCTLVYSLLNIFSTLDLLSNLIVNLQDKLVILELLRQTETQLEPLTVDNLGLIVRLFEVITGRAFYRAVAVFESVPMDIGCPTRTISSVFSVKTSNIQL